MTLDIDIYRSAKIFLDQHGESSLVEARARYQEFLMADNLEAADVWFKIVEAIDWMQSGRKHPLESSH